VTEDRAFAALTAKISGERGISCESYKDKCLKRRIAVRMRARGIHTYEDYAKLLDRDPREYQELLDTLTINVTKFYRNPETWKALRPYLAGLWTARAGHLRIWSAGCASGEEPYTIAMLVAETIANKGMDAILQSHVFIHATDIDRLSLERTNQARYADGAFSELPADLRRRYFQGGRPAEHLRSMVRVIMHDLTREPPPLQQYDMIVCRNVVIYFERQAQERLFQRFVDALTPGGVLVLGKVETLFGPARERLTLMDPRERIYMKPA
jgi:chemotaxis methyl-accepting protein methylase